MTNEQLAILVESECRSLQKEWTARQARLDCYGEAEIEEFKDFVVQKLARLTVAVRILVSGEIGAVLAD